MGKFIGGIATSATSPQVRFLCRPQMADLRLLFVVQALFATMTQVAFAAASHPIRIVKETRVDGAIDGCAADGMLAVFMAQSVLDLLRRPLLLKEFFFNQRIEFSVIELALAPTSLALLLVIRLCPNGVIHVFVAT